YGSTGLAAQEPVTITGKVTSDAGLPLGQVELAIPTMGLGALSREDGRYAILVPGARASGQTVTLVARRLGYKSQPVQVTLTAGGSRTVGLPNSGSSQPLFVVDGVPIDNTSFSTTDFNPVDGLTSGAIEGTTQTNRAADINPADIESVEILKGAAAAAIYGSR